MISLAGTAYLGRALGVAQAWSIVFAIGAATSASYLLLGLFTLSEKTKHFLFETRLQTRVILTGLIFVPFLATISYMIYQTGSVEALPFFPVFIATFYAWTLLQAFFIATPVSQVLNRTENRIVGEGTGKSTMRTLSISMLFLPVAPLIYGVWMISSWLNTSYQNIQGANEKILAWTLLVTVLIVSTYFLTVQWSWKTIREKKPQSAIFVGGTFLAVWAYLLYRATMIAIGYVTANQPTNPLVDSSLVVVSIVGAMQTFARKTIRSSNPRWSRILPFLVFAFGTVFAVAQYYFILQASITRSELSLIVNTTVFVTGLVIMMYLIRRHISIGGNMNHISSTVIATTGSTSSNDISQSRQRHLPSIHFHRKKKSIAEQVQELREEVESSKQTGPAPVAQEQELQQSAISENLVEENNQDPELEDS